MVISRRNRAQPPSDSAFHQRQSRPWDNHIALLKPAAPVTQVSVSDRLRLFEQTPPPSRDSNPLNAFLPPVHRSPSPTPSAASSRPHLSSQSSASPPPSPPPPLKTRIGNRDLVPLFTSPSPPPLIGLPIPAPISRPRSTSSKPPPQPTTAAAKIASQIPIPPPPPLPDMSDQNPQPDKFSRRFSVRHSRHSMRIPSAAGPLAPAFMDDSANFHAAPVHQPMSTMPHHNQLDLLPDSSSFLDYNSDHRTNHLDGTELNESSARDHTSFDDHDDRDVPDSFDTFASFPNQVDLNMEPKRDLPTPPAPLSEKPLLPNISFGSGSNLQALPPKPRPAPSVVDDDDGGLDIPVRFSVTPAAGHALRDLQRASITAANELANSIRLMSQEPRHGSLEEADALSQRTHSTPSQGMRDGGGGGGNNSCQKLQGQLMLRSRLFRRWNLRYATVVNQAYFGPVLLLFRPDKPLFQSAFTLKSSKMIALTHSKVTEHEKPRKHNNGLIYMFDLTTSQRTYTFACTDLKTRSLWVTNLSSQPPPM